MRKYILSNEIFNSLQDVYSFFSIDSKEISTNELIFNLLKIDVPTIIYVGKFNKYQSSIHILDILENVQQKNDFIYLIRGIE